MLQRVQQVTSNNGPLQMTSMSFGDPLPSHLEKTTVEGVDQEPTLRLHARTSLLSGVREGRLEETLQRVQQVTSNNGPSQMTSVCFGDTSPSQSERVTAEVVDHKTTLRLHARTSLLSGVREGRLEEKLQRVQQVTSNNDPSHTTSVCFGDTSPSQMERVTAEVVDHKTAPRLHARTSLLSGVREGRLEETLQR